ncbi:hypothetical protein N752_15365 [Desulforamulus aquiferis]|nr:bifunctional hydroxymethylpyrimidine kinase/phosphomethylpyrimidine kinase [Desulforamulus aquiferis]RYD04221.1 hypothetical protein N752_15365 [Desulforamulus aquiferis]
MKHVLTVAGSDSCGGAGIQADLKTFSALGTYGMSVITAVTAQNTTGVVMVREMDPEMVAAQINCIFEDIKVHAVKVGMVSSAEIITTIGNCLARHRAVNIVIDPVMVSKSRCNLLRPEACETLVKVLFPLATIVTPNIPEAEVIVGGTITSLEDMKGAAVKIYNKGAKNVIVKGGHMEGPAIDVLYDGKQFLQFSGERVATTNTHGTGCTFSSAIAAYLARGLTMTEAIEGAKKYIHRAIAHSFPIGRGVGPTNHFHELYEKAGLLD